MHCSLNINGSFEVDKINPGASGHACDLFFPPKGYVDGALFTIIICFNANEGKLKKAPFCFSMKLIAFPVTDFNENYAENHLFPNGSSQQNWKRKQYKSMETEPFSLIN